MKKNWMLDDDMRVHLLSLLEEFHVVRFTLSLENANLQLFYSGAEVFDVKVTSFANLPVKFLRVIKTPFMNVSVVCEAFFVICLMAWVTFQSRSYLKRTLKFTDTVNSRTLEADETA